MIFWSYWLWEPYGAMRSQGEAEAPGFPVLALFIRLKTNRISRTLDSHSPVGLCVAPASRA